MSEQTMVERVARAIAAVMATKSLDSDASAEPNEEDYECARAAIAAMRVPTEAMMRSGDQEQCRVFVEDKNTNAEPFYIYTAMIDAALSEDAA